MTKKLCKDQREALLTKLTALFKSLEEGAIDDVVSAAKRKAAAETAEGRREGLAELFDSQMETQKSLGCPQAILDSFSDKRAEALSKAAGMEIPEGHIPFVQVIPRSYLGTYGLMSMVRNGEKVGYTYLDPNEITDKVETPKEPYFIYDVENGKDMLGKSPQKAEKLVKKQGRSCLTADEGIALCIHTDVLARHNVDCTGSRYWHAVIVPSVFLCDDGPLLVWNAVGFSRDEWGSASCCSRS